MLLRWLQSAGALLLCNMGCHGWCLQHCRHGQGMGNMQEQPRQGRPAEQLRVTNSCTPACLQLLLHACVHLLLQADAAPQHLDLLLRVTQGAAQSLSLLGQAALLLTQLQLKGAHLQKDGVGWGRGRGWHAGGCQQHVHTAARPGAGNTCIKAMHTQPPVVQLQIETWCAAPLVAMPAAPPAPLTSLSILWHCEVLVASTVLRPDS